MKQLRLALFIVVLVVVESGIAGQGATAPSRDPRRVIPLLRKLDHPLVSAHRQSGIHGRDVSLVTEARVRRQPFALALSGNQSFPVTSRITRMIRRSPPGP